MSRFWVWVHCFLLSSCVLSFTLWFCPVNLPLLGSMCAALLLSQSVVIPSFTLYWSFGFSLIFPVLFGLLASFWILDSEYLFWTFCLFRPITWFWYSACLYKPLHFILNCWACHSVTSVVSASASGSYFLCCHWHSITLFLKTNFQSVFLRKYFRLGAKTSTSGG